MPAASLRLEGLTVNYGGVTAVDAVDLEVGQGELVGLIGPNGAGKTSLIDAVTGFTTAAGEVWLGDYALTGSSPATRARAGLARTWQGGDLFDELTVGENVAVARSRAALLPTLFRDLGGRSRKDAGSPLVDFELLGLSGMEDTLPEQLTQGQRKLVGVARALAADPKVLLLDEPAAGLNTDESRELGEQLRKLVDEGLPTVLVDHDMGLVFSVCDRVVVLDFGKVIALGTAAEVRGDPQVAKAYLGTSDAKASDLAFPPDITEGGDRS